MRFWKSEEDKSLFLVCRTYLRKIATYQKSTKGCSVPFKGSGGSGSLITTFLTLITLFNTYDALHLIFTGVNNRQQSI